MQHVFEPEIVFIADPSFMSPNCNLQLADARWFVWMFLGWNFCLNSVLLLPKVPERKPSKCPRCEGELRLFANTNSHGSGFGVAW